MSSNCREVCLEVYVNGELYCTESGWVPDEKDVQMEFMITEHIYELLGCSSGEITAQLEVDTNECMSVSHCALEDELHIDIDMNHPTCTCKAPESSPTESTTEWMIKKMSGLFQTLFWMDPAVPDPTVPDLDQVPERDQVPEPEPEVNLVSVCWPAEVSGSSSGIEANDSNSKGEITKEEEMTKMNAFFKKYFPIDPAKPLCPEPELDLIDTKESCVPVPSVPDSDSDDSRVPVPRAPDVQSESALVDLFPAFSLVSGVPDSDSDDSCVPVPIIPDVESESDRDDLFPAFHLVSGVSDSDSDDSCVPGPSNNVPKSGKCTSKQEPFPVEHCFRLEKRVKGCTQRRRPVTAVWNNIFIGNEEIARDRMVLKELGITHVLNAAAVKNKLRVFLGVPREKDLKDAVNTGSSYYRGSDIKYCGLPASHGSDISKYFYKAAKFILKAKKNTENKVFIHCTEGISYAPTLFLAYLMIHHNMTVEDAIDHLIKARYIKPDIEFLKQLAVLNQDLVHKRETTATANTSRKPK